MWLVLCAAFTFWMAAGNSNGFGVFQQPHNKLLMPLALGGVINAASFYLLGFVAIPRRGAPTLIRILPAIGLICLGNVLAQTLVQELIIAASEPSLATVSFGRLATENSLMTPVLVAAAVVYRFARDGVLHITRRGPHTPDPLDASAAEVMRPPSDTRDPSTVNKFIYLRNGRRQLQLRSSELRYLKAAGNYIEVVTTTRSYLVYGALKTVLPLLPPDLFARTHRSYIVGLHHVTSVAPDSVSIGPNEIPVARAYRKTLRPDVGETQRRRRPSALKTPRSQARGTARLPPEDSNPSPRGYRWRRSR